LRGRREASKNKGRKAGRKEERNKRTKEERKRGTEEALDQTDHVHIKNQRKEERQMI
jgi:hypothetical protein